MKKFKFLGALVAFATLLGLTSCSDDPAELLNGGQGPAGSTILNVNYTIPGDSTRVFVATSMSATASDSDIVINALNEDTGEALEIYFTGSKVQTDAQASYVASITYFDADGKEYSGFSPFTSKQTGAVRLTAIDTGAKVISGVFSFIGYDDEAAVPADGVPFFSGIFMEIPYTGTLPEPTYMKATIDSTLVDFETVATITTQDTVTTYRGTNVTPKYSLDMKFIDNADIVQGATVNLGEKLKVEVKIDETLYIAKTGSVTFNTVTDVVATGTFTFTAAKEGETETIQITGGDFKVLVE